MSSGQDIYRSTVTSSVYCAEECTQEYKKNTIEEQISADLLAYMTVFEIKYTIKSNVRGIGQYRQRISPTEAGRK